jgi:hypothetical protein
MNMERHVQQRSMFGPWSGEAKISGMAPGCSSGVPPVAGWANIGSASACV